MTFIPRIRPGGEIDVAAFNQLVDTANRKLRSAISNSIRDSEIGLALTAARTTEPIFGLLTTKGTAERPDAYGFNEVKRNADGQWEEMPGGLVSDLNNDFGDAILNPAIEVGSNKGVDLNTIVQLYPADRLVIDEHGRQYREWYFSNRPDIKAFSLLADLIPTGGGEPDTSIRGYFLQDPVKQPVTLWPAHPAGFDTGWGLSLGIGRGPGGYAQGTWGWAQWVDRATADDSTGEVVWRGEWQIVTLYASLHAEVRVYDADIPTGGPGLAQLWWRDKNSFAVPLINSTYQLTISNTRNIPLVVGDRVDVQFDRHDYRWYPVGPGTDTPFYGVAQADWVETSNDSPYVSIKRCDGNLANVRGGAFRCYLLRRRDDTSDFDPDVYSGDRVTWRYDEDGNAICISPYLHSKIGDIKPCNQKAEIPTGWRLCDGSATVDATGDGGRVLKQRDGAESVGDQAGIIEFGVSRLNDNTHAGAASRFQQIDEEGTGVSGGNAVENRGPWVNVELIERWK